VVIEVILLRPLYIQYKSNIQIYNSDLLHIFQYHNDTLLYSGQTRSSLCTSK